jgi:hypothetical protein
MKEIYALYISLAALIVSVFSLGWNFYRDVILKPRLKVTVAITRVGSTERGWEDFITVSAVNLGPGPIICNGILGEKKHFLRFWEKRISFYAVEDFNNPLSTPLPKKLEVGDSLMEFFNLKEDAFLSMDPTHIGVRDTFGRMHCASKKSLKKAKKDFLKGFPKKHIN